MTSLPGLHRRADGWGKGGRGVAGGNATQRRAIACRSPRSSHTGNNTRFYFYPRDFLFPSGQSIQLMLSINILLKCDKADESFNCCGTRQSISCRYLLAAKCDNRLFSSHFIHPAEADFSFLFFLFSRQCRLPGFCLCEQGSVQSYKEHEQ